MRTEEQPRSSAATPMRFPGESVAQAQGRAWPRILGAAAYERRLLLPSRPGDWPRNPVRTVSSEDHPVVVRDELPEAPVPLLREAAGARFQIGQERPSRRMAFLLVIEGDGLPARKAAAISREAKPVEEALGADEGHVPEARGGGRVGLDRHFGFEPGQERAAHTVVGQMPFQVVEGLEGRRGGSRTARVCAAGGRPRSRGRCRRCRCSSGNTPRRNRWRRPSADRCAGSARKRRRTRPELGRPWLPVRRSTRPGAGWWPRLRSRTRRTRERRA